MTTVLVGAGDFTVDTIGGLCLTRNDAERVTGWTLKSEGMCRGSVCVPLPAGMIADGRVDVAAFWRHLGNPVVENRDVWVLGSSADDRNVSLTGLRGPDITLPDLSGVPHTLSALLGTKVLLTTWASW